MRVVDLSRPSWRIGVALFTDGVQSAVERALAGVSARQRVTAQNIANAATPGYRAQRVDFERDLSRALRTGRPATARIDTVDAGGAAAANGNSVSLGDELTSSVKSGLQYQALVNAASFKLGLMRTAIGGR